MAVSLLGCTQMIPIDRVSNSGTIINELTMDEVREAIEEGARNAGWDTKEKGDDQIMAFFRIRTHSVIVMINYSRDEYSIEYNSSREMKVQCTDADHKQAKNIIITGRKSCPGSADPKYIHQNYEKWVTRLKASINHSIAYAD
jgi:hypothetical protein